MSSEKKQICPWCSMEIIWDPEIGPEKECPYCFNELSEYRTVVPSDFSSQDADKAEKQTVPEKVTVDLDLAESEQEAKELRDWVEPDDSDLFAYEEEVDRLLERQDEQMVCPSCQEHMVLAGTQQVQASEFVIHKKHAEASPFLTAPFSYDVFVCPSCFQLKHVLSEEDRLSVYGRMNEN